MAAAPDLQHLGAPPLPPEMRREATIRICFTRGDMADLHAIAGAWGVPTGTAVWALVASELRRIRAIDVSGGEGRGVTAEALRMAMLLRAAPEGHHAESMEQSGEPRESV